ncbi:MAG: type I restriction enzyme HsdR N-terminal domain-containing protein [Saprospiraceae bacterium]
MINIDLTAQADHLRIKREQGKRQVFDPSRKKYVAFTPEELVRQLLISYLINEKQYNLNRIAAEKTVVYNGMQKRFDLVVFDADMNPFLLAECKSADQPINLSVFEQVSRYNKNMQVPYILVTNGPELLCCEMDYEEKSYNFLDQLPEYPLLR